MAFNSVSIGKFFINQPSQIALLLAPEDRTYQQRDKFRKQFDGFYNKDRPYGGLVTCGTLCHPYTKSMYNHVMIVTVHEGATFNIVLADFNNGKFGKKVLRPRATPIVAGDKDQKVPITETGVEVMSAWEKTD